MTLLHIGVLGIAALLVGAVPSPRWKGLLLVAGSVLALYWIQPATPIRNLDFWLPTLTIVLTVLTWALCLPPAERAGYLREDRLTAGLLLALVLFVGLSRLLGPICCITATRPPPPPLVLIAIAGAALLLLAFSLLRRRPRWTITVVILLLLALLVILKTDALALSASRLLRNLVGQAPEGAAAFDVGWLGVSYVFFRLISAARDKQIGTLPAMRFDAFLSYVLFFPTLTAGPLDRADRFLKDLENGSGLAAQTFFAGGQRIILGMFKKYVLADLLALFALNSVNAVQTDSTLWTWLLLYGYAFRIFFDFAGYSDIAIGLGKWAGFSVPENFNSPYLKPDLTAFWNSWHMSLAGWFRAYYFNPVSRWMRTVKRPKLSMPVLIAVGQISTMVLIGLWHGITVNFFLWGVWHGVGLFVHNRWADRTRAQARKLGEKPRLQRAVSLGTTLLTFHFVALGWVFFTLPDTGLAFEVLGRLFGF